MNRMALVGLSAAAGMALVVGVSPQAAQAAPKSTSVTCGQTIKASIRLAHDLTGCPGDGLVIGAANVTVDLGGHSITGTNAAGSEGIADDGHAGVRIQNGMIAHFFLNGIGLRKAPRSVVRHVTIRQIGAGGVEPATSAGVLVKDSPDTLITATTVNNQVTAFQSDGVDVLSSARTQLIGSRIVHNSWNGVFVLSSPATRVLSNVLSGNPNQGIEVNAGSDGTRVAANKILDNGNDGIAVGAVTGVRIEGNYLTGNTVTGVFMFDLHDSRVRLNHAYRNGVGIDLEGGQNGSDGNRLEVNDTSRNVFAGLVVGGGATHNLVAGNVADANQGGSEDGGGIVIFGATGNTVRGNVANRNRDVGIGVFEDQPGDAAGNVLASNVANNNHDHGITVVKGTVDGGRNIARGNVPRPNCVGVTCNAAPRN